MPNFDLISILQLASLRQLPRAVDEDSGIDLHAFDQLRDGGLIKAIDASADGGKCCLEPSITLAGLEYLRRHLAGALNQP